MLLKKCNGWWDKQLKIWFLSYAKSFGFRVILFSFLLVLSKTILASKHWLSLASSSAESISCHWWGRPSSQQIYVFHSAQKDPFDPAGPPELCACQKSEWWVAANIIAGVNSLQEWRISHIKGERFTVYGFHFHSRWLKLWRNHPNHPLGIGCNKIGIISDSTCTKLNGFCLSLSSLIWSHGFKG